MTTIADIIYDVEHQLDNLVQDLPRVTANKIGLDIRAGRVWIDLDSQLIIVGDDSVRTLEYYGGFEYVDDACTVTIGRYKIYNAESSRVEGCLQQYEELVEETLAEYA